VERLGRYLLERKLATGGMAEIFLARQTGPSGFERTCVVKRMLSHHAQDAEFVQMFLDEARLGARLAHPGVAQIIDFGAEQGRYFIAMEYIDGASLSTVLQIHRQQRLQVPILPALRVTALVAATLDHSHRAKDENGHSLDLIHRDVSPQNIMISSLGEVKLIDFGIAKASNARHRTAVGTMKGKIAYMSPEQLRQQPVTNKSDVYSLGLVLYELLAGVPAIRGDSHAALLNAAAKRQITSLSVIRPEVQADVRAIVDAALAVDPSQRLSAGELSDQLDDAIARSGARVKPAGVAALLHLELTTAATNPGMADPNAREATTIEPHPGGPIEELLDAEDFVPIEDEAPATLDHPQQGGGPALTVEAIRSLDPRERPTTRGENEPFPAVAEVDAQANISTNPRFLAEAPPPSTDKAASPAFSPATIQLPQRPRRRLRRSLAALFVLAVLGLVLPDAWLRFAPPDAQQRLTEAGFTPQPVWPWLRAEAAEKWKWASETLGL
jgi:serine/threonine-protein kinase